MNKQNQLIQAALALRASQEYAQSISLLDKAIALDKGFAPAYIYLGLVYQDNNEAVAAEAAFRQALLLEPDNLEALQCLGMMYLEQARIPEAIANLEKHLKLEADNKISLDVLVPLLVQSDRARDAETFLRAAWLKSMDNNAAVRYVRFLISQEKLEQAHSFLVEAVQFNKSATLFVEQALILVIQQKYDEAIQFLWQALSLHPDYDRAYRGLAHCYTQLGQADKALEYAEKALAIDAQHYRNWQAKGDALLIAERYEDALIAAQAGINLIDPADLEARPVLVVLYLQRVNAYLAQKDTDMALAELAQGRKALPNEDVFYGRAIQICMQRNCVDDAIGVIEEALQAGLPSSEQWIGFGYELFLQSELYEQAFAFGLKKLDQYPNALDVFAGVGIEHYSKGYPAVAQHIFEILLNHLPQDLRFLTNLSYVLIGENQTQQARLHLEKVLAAHARDEELGHQHIALCNLGYLDLIEGHFDQAKDFLSQVIDIAPPTEGAILRVAFWWNNHLVPDYAPHPTRSLPLRAAAYANLVTVALAQHDTNQAQQWASHLQKEFDLPVVGESLGTVFHSLGKAEYAQQALETALKQVEDSLERQMIEKWLVDLG